VLASPHVAPLGIVVFAILLLLVAISMIGISVRNIIAGQSTIEVERARPSRKNRSGERRRFLWLPATDDAPGRVVRIDPNLKLYDLGPAANWRATMGERPLDWLMPWRPSQCADGLSYRIRPSLLGELRASVTATPAEGDEPS